MGIFDIFQSKKKKQTVLFIDDDQAILNNYKTLFEYNKVLSEKFDFIFASNKKEFTQLIEQADIVFSDYHMPDLKFEQVWIACENKKPLVALTGEIRQVWPGKILPKLMKPGVLPQEIIKMAESGTKAPTYVKKTSTATKKAA